MSFRFNPLSGTFDYFSPPSDTAKRVVETKTADVNMSALTFVYATSDTNVDKATNDGTYAQATVLGMTLSSVVAGNQVDILLFAKVEDPFFTYTVNDLLFLGTNGTITNVAPSLPLATHSTSIGQSLGSGAIFINIEKSIIL